MSIITECPTHGVVNSEAAPWEITYAGFYNPGRWNYCPFCGKPVTVTWPNRKSSLWKKVEEMKTSQEPKTWIDKLIIQAEKE